MISPCIVLLLCIGLSDLMLEIHQDFSSRPISSLCSVDSSPNHIKFKCFEVAKPVWPILNHYYFLSDKHYSALFQQIWKSKLNEVSRPKLLLTLQDVVAKIWDPVFSECCQLVDSVRKRSIKLKKVDFYFQIEVGGVSLSLRKLYTAVEACRDNKSDNLSFGWVQTSVDLMEQYWALCKQAEAAKIVLKLKEELELTGDFEIIEDVASRASMMDASLESIGQKNLKEAKSFLDKFTEGSGKLECLKKFAACLNIVEWMRKETKGIISEHLWW